MTQMKATQSGKTSLPWLRQDRAMKYTTREAIYGFLFISPWVLGFIAFTAGPMIGTFGISLFDTDFLTRNDFVGFQWYKSILGDTLVHKAFINTAIYAFVTVPLGTILALMIAVLLNQGIRGQSVWRTIYYLPSIVSGVAVAILWRWLYQPDVGLFNTLLSYLGIQGPRWVFSEEWAMPSIILVALWGAGAPMLIFLAGLQSIPTALYEAAEIDGAGPITRFFYITIPMLTPTIFFNVVLSIIGSWQVFTQALILTEGGPNNATLTVVLHLYRTGFRNFYFGYASAQAWVLFLVVLVFVVLALRSASSWVQYERV
jgi:multiple sugar transport system permease protein